VVFAFIAIWIFQYTTTVAKERLENELNRSALGGAATISAPEFVELNATVPAVPDGTYEYGLGYPDSPLYDLIARELFSIRQIVKDAKVYSYYLDPADGKLYFSASGGYYVTPEPVGVQFKVPVIDVVDPATYAYMEQGLTATTEQKEYSDDFGNFISSYTPILDDAGTPVGAIGLDYPQSYVAEVQDGIRRQLFPVLGFSYIALLLLVLVLSTSLARPLRRLTAATGRIANGEYDLDVTGLVRTRFPDEMFTLAESFAEMAKKVGLRERTLTREVQRLKVEIDHTRREEAVKEITESDFFSDLTAKAAEMRRKARPESEG
jgi:methyl-accepting chemotaxis protein